MRRGPASPKHWQKFPPEVAALLRERFSLAEMLSDYGEKFGVADVGHVLYALAYFDEAEKEPMPRLLWEEDWRSVKRALRKRLRDFAG